MRVEGFSMKSAGINDGDLIIVDRSRKAQDESVIVAALNGELVIRRLKLQDGRTFLISDNANYKAIEIYSDTDFEIHGVVTYSISKCI